MNTEQDNLCYCILTLQYIKCHCVAGYLLVFCKYRGPHLVGIQQRYISVIFFILDNGLDDLVHGSQTSPSCYQTQVTHGTQLLRLVGQLDPTHTHTHTYTINSSVCVCVLLSILIDRPAHAPPTSHPYSLEKSLSQVYHLTRWTSDVDRISNG